MFVNCLTIKQQQQQDEFRKPVELCIIRLYQLRTNWFVHECNACAD